MGVKDEIRPCPFCKSEAVGYYGDTTPFLTRGRYWIYCMRCEAQGPKAETRNDAIRKWNSR